MDEIDQALFEAWMRVGERCQRDRWEASRRFQRVRRPSVSAPVRQWCLCVRAADTRIDSHRAIIEPVPNVVYGWDCDSDSIVRRRFEHRVTLSGGFIRELTRPVRIPWPGVPLWEAEHMLGMSRDYVRAWVRRGVLAIARHDYCRVHGKRCKPIPIVFTRGGRPVDPQMPAGAEPDSVWGSLWRWKGEMLPEGFEQSLERVPRMRPRYGEMSFRGWDWRCPGRLGTNGEFTGCGRLCKYVFAPLPPCTLAKSICEWTFEMPEESGLKGTWHPGLQHAEVGKGRRTFACKHCWGVRNPSMLKHVGWNEFVSYISGGLLYGREVERPPDEAAYVRKHAWAERRARKPAEKRDETVTHAQRQA